MEEKEYLDKDGFDALAESITSNYATKTQVEVLTDIQASQKEDVLNLEKVKADKQSTIQTIYTNDGANVKPDAGELYFNSQNGIDINQTSPNTITFSADTDYLATKASVDDIKNDFNSLLNDENLNDSFDTLKEVDTWIKSHEEEAANLIEDVNELQNDATLKYIRTHGAISTYMGLANNISQSFIEVAFDSVNANGDGKQRTVVKRINGVTSTGAGVMTVDLYNELKAATSEITSLKTEISTLKSEITSLKNNLVKYK